jgi:hypothetical protein
MILLKRRKNHQKDQKITRKIETENREKVGTENHEKNGPQHHTVTSVGVRATD